MNKISCLRSLLVILPLGLAPAHAETFRTETVAVEAEILADGLRNPWSLAFLPNGEAIVTERPGTMRILSSDGRLSEPLEGVPDVAARGPGRPAGHRHRAGFRQYGHHCLQLLRTRTRRRRHCGGAGKTGARRRCGAP
jgi:glucose/arabinose dehydrogenase